VIISCLLLAAATALLAGLLWSAATMILAMAAAALAQSLGKLSLDALVQREVPEEVRASAFARGETALQLAWVIGGAIGIVLPLAGPDAFAWLLTGGRLGLLVSAAGLTAALAITARDVHRTLGAAGPDGGESAGDPGAGPSDDGPRPGVAEQPADPVDHAPGSWAVPTPDDLDEPPSRPFPTDAPGSAEPTVRFGVTAEGPTTRVPTPGADPAPPHESAHRGTGAQAPRGPGSPASPGRPGSGQVGGGGHAPATAWWVRPAPDPPADAGRSEG
jgi:hypothetical protein